MAARNENATGKNQLGQNLSALMTSPQDTIRAVHLFLKKHGYEIIDNKAQNIDYFGLGQRRENNILCKSHYDETIRICIRTQFTGGGAWQKSLYTLQMLNDNSNEDYTILLYHGTDSRFLDHMAWINEFSSNRNDSVNVIALSNFEDFLVSLK